MTDEDALRCIIHWLRAPQTFGYGSYGYEMYLPIVLRGYLSEQQKRPPTQIDDREMRELSPHFYAAAWELCRRGILRPGIRIMDAQATADGASGNGYSVTPFGRQWLAEADRDDFVPTEPERFGAILRPLHERLGPGFASRAQEAVRCYGAHAYLACCAMVGAATESVLLAAAIAIKRDEGAVLREYASAKGRGRVESVVIAQAREDLQRQFRGFTSLLGYWRDEAAHGRASRLSDVEALTALAMLVRFAHFVNDHWDELTRRN